MVFSHFTVLKRYNATIQEMYIHASPEFLKIYRFKIQLLAIPKIT